MSLSGVYTHGLSCTGDHVVAVQLGDVVYADALRASGFALVLVGAVAEAHGVHLAHHGEHALVLFGLALRQQVEVSSLGGGEEHGGAVLAACHTGTTADAGRSVESGISRLLAYGHVVGVGGRTRAHVHKAASGNDVVQRGTVYHQVTQQRECSSTEGLNPDGVAILELAHVQLAGCYLLATVGHTVDGEGAHAADAFAAVVVEVNGLLALVNKPFVDDVEHLEEGGVIRDVGSLVGFDAALSLSILLSPDLVRKIVVSHNVM